MTERLQPACRLPSRAGFSRRQPLVEEEALQGLRRLDGGMGEAKLPPWLRATGLQEPCQPSFLPV